MNKNKLIALTLSALLYNGIVVAHNIEIVGTQTKTVQIPSPPSSTNSLQKESDKLKTITLLDVRLSSEASKNLANKAQAAMRLKDQFTFNQSNKNINRRVQLGMNNVPVLNQGHHGTCVTFATTAAIDAALNKGDYISQLCSLQLGNYLMQHGYSFSGWNGSWGRNVLNQLEVFGVISKEKEKAWGCAGLFNYPTSDDAGIDSPMSIDEYHQRSENINELVVWSPILDVYQALADRIDAVRIVDEVKAALKAGDRMTMGVLLLDFDLGFMGAVGKNKVAGDSWVLTPEIARDVVFNPKFGGHEMVITGYDDDAVAIDDKGQEHRGLFTLRNSWGDQVGNHGDFYMSYDYFKLLAVEVLRLRTEKDD